MQCPRCGILASVKAERCPSCGLKFHVHVPAPADDGQPAAPVAVLYAGFWRRLASFSIDSIILGALSSAAFEILRIIYRVNYGKAKVPASWNGMLSIVSTVAFIVLPAILESSRYPASPGKMLSEIIVTNSRGGRIGFGRALARNFLKILSLAFLFPFIPIALPGRKRGLYDMMTGCLVILKEPKRVVSPVAAPQPKQQTQASNEVTALPVEPQSNTTEKPKTEENWLYL